MMLEAIRAFFTERMSVAEPVEAGQEGPLPVQVAACALLLELAYADDEFTDAERRHLEDALHRHFNLTRETTKTLIEVAEAERQQAVDLYQFTRLIAKHYDKAQKIVLLETMWGLVYADGEVAKHEKYLMRQVSRLLDVEAGFLSQARKRVEDST